MNNTSWSNIDVLLTTPNMLEYTTRQKENYDPFDINPEVIIIDDFDCMIKYI